MFRLRRLALAALIGACLTACAGPAKKPLVDPFPFRFPLIEAAMVEIEGHVVGQPRARDGIVYYATREGYVTAVVISSRSILWRRPGKADQAEAGVELVPDDREEPLFRAEGKRLLAFDAQNKLIWEFAAGGAISAGPTVSDGRLFFGTGERRFCRLDAATGKLKWSRRLQGAPVGNILVKGDRVVVAASNSVVYTLSAKGGSILSWEAVPSRVIHELTMAGAMALVTSASQTMLALDPSTGRRAGQHLLQGPALAGALWVSPYVVVVIEDPDTGRQRLAILLPKGR